MFFIDWIVRFLVFGRGIFSLALAVITSLYLLSLGQKQKQVFHEVAVSTFLYPAQAIISHVNYTVLVSRENRQLKMENAALSLRNDILTQELRLQPRLENFQAYSDTTEHPIRMARIVGRDPGRFASTWVIDVGAEDSVSVNMPVLTPKGVVGRIARSFARHSLVQPLSDPGSKISVLCDRSRVSGILESHQLDQLVARFPGEADILPGDTIVTSGMGGVFPKGLSVGVVGSKEILSSDILKAVEVLPLQDPFVVEEVFVLLREPRWTLEGAR